MLEFWGLFDMLHLSFSKSEAVRKILTLIKSSPSYRSQVLNLDDSALKRVRENKDFSEPVCRLMALGEFEMAAKIIAKSDYYKKGDILISGIVKGIQQFGLCLNYLMYNKDYQY